MQKRNWIRWGGIAAFGGLLGIVGGTAVFSAQDASLKSLKVAPGVKRKLLENGSVPILVQLKEQPTYEGAEEIANREERIRFVYDRAREVALNSQAELKKVLDAKGVPHRSLYLGNFIVVDKADEALITEMTQHPTVARILNNPTVKQTFPKQIPQDADRVALPKGALAVGDNITFTGAVEIWKQLGTKGEGIVVAGQDTGIQWDHPALKNQYRGFDGTAVDHNYNWYDAIHKTTGGSNPCGYDTQAPCDDNAHGTHTIGTVVGSDGDKNEIGMAPGAKWIGCRNMDEGNGTPETYIECFQFFLAPFAYGGNPMTDGNPAKAPHIINNSWGCPPSEGCTGAEILPSLQAMKAAGILVVASAGNEGPGCGTIGNPPAYHTDLVLSVGAYNHRSKTIASFSSRGPSTFDGGVGPDIVAPGVDIRSAVPGSKYEQQFWSGTSMAGPHVVGAAALLWAAKPELIGKFDATKAIFRSTAKPQASTQTCGNVQGTATPNNTFGYGVMDALKAATNGQASVL